MIEKIDLWGICFTRLTSLAPHHFLLSWLKLNLLLDQIRLV